MTLQQRGDPAITTGSPVSPTSVCHRTTESSGLDRAKTAIRNLLLEWLAQRPYNGPAWLQEASMRAAQREKARR